LKIIILSESEIRQCVQMDLEAIGAVEEGFRRLAEGRVALPPILQIMVDEHKGEVDAKAAYIEGLDSFAVKIASGYADNYRLGLPSGSGLMIVFDSRTGFPQAVLLDNGYLTDVRTGAAGAVAAKNLARKDVGTVGVVGSGAQARFQMLALKQVRDYRRVLIHGLIPEQVQQYVTEMSPVLGVPVAAAPDEETLVRESDIVVCCTPARQPHLQAAWLHPGLHITAMGADSPRKQELEAAVLGRADRLACDRREQCFQVGELHHGLEEGAITRDTDIAELGELVAGMKPGRRSEHEITVCDLTGIGVQDTAIALLAYRKAVEKGLGKAIES
jgi:ectoine utilization protein EutC